MKRGDKPSGDTPYRIDTQSEEAVRQNKQLIKEMEKNIEMSGKFSIQLPENLGPEDAPLQCHIPNLDLPIFLDLIEIKTNSKTPKKISGPQGVSFYSLQTGILNYDGVLEYFDGNKEYYYKNENDKNIRLEIHVEKDKAMLTVVATKEDSEKRKAKNLPANIVAFEQQTEILIRQLKKAGVEEVPEIESGLSDLKTSLERLLYIVAGKLEEKK